MKNYMVLFLVIILMSGMTGCGKMETVSSEEESKVSTLHTVEDDTFENYTLEQAKKEECLVHEDGEVTYGKEHWEQFVEDTKDGKKSSIRLVSYYTLGDPSQYEPEYYEEVKDEYPQLYVNDLTFDGEVYTYHDYSDVEPCISNYKYLMRYEGKKEIESASYDSYLIYALTNDDTVTWEELWRGMVSSRLGDSIPHYCVYTEYIYDEK